MDSVIEQQRQYHEEIERLIQGAADVRGRTFSTQHRQVNADHHVRRMLERIAECSQELLKLYADKDGAKAMELSQWSSGRMDAFDARMKEVRAFHQKYPNEIAAPMQPDLMPQAKKRAPAPSVPEPQGPLTVAPVAAKEEPEDDEYLFPDYVEFTGEEGYGRHFDLHAQHELYVNLKGARPLEYIQYLQVFDQLFTYPQANKNSAPYKRYLDSLLSYLKDFFTRAFPLRNLEEAMAKAIKEFEVRWHNSNFTGWEGHKPLTSDDIAPVDLSPYNSAAELEELGAERLKLALMAAGLKCGGTVHERAQRLFSIKGKRKEDIDKALLVKKRQTQGSANGSGESAVEDALKGVAVLEAQIYRLAELLSDVRAATKENVERRQARTADELDADDDDDIVQLEDEEEGDEEMQSAQRTNLVVDWEGKPIPYWLYRLHGLSKVYTCEICGDFPYRGPKGFQQHFSEWRHAHGMRQLGIPNTKHFINITKIDDARKLWSRLQGSKRTETFEDANEEEYEDSMGNVMPKKVYLDLQRQGLL